MEPYAVVDDAHDESYFASFTDLLVGVLFIFIILLMMYASNFNKKVEEAESVKQSRDVVLQELQKSLENEGIKVSIDLEQGTLRLPEDVLFNVDQSVLSPKGVQDIEVLANVLSKYLPCLAMRIPYDEVSERFCETLNLKSRGKLETLLIEGHTDHTGSREHNWDLSIRRAISVFRTLTEAAPVLDEGIVTQHLGKSGEKQMVPVIAVSGYEARRPVPESRNEPKDPELRKKNRRIDLRFVMRSPTPEELRSIENEANGRGANDVSP